MIPCRYRNRLRFRFALFSCFIWIQYPAVQYLCGGRIPKIIMGDGLNGAVPRIRMQAWDIAGAMLVYDFEMLVILQVCVMFGVWKLPSSSHKWVFIAGCVFSFFYGLIIFIGYPLNLWLFNAKGVCGPY